MAGELQLGGTTLATHTGSGASAKINLDSGLVFPAGHIVQSVFSPTLSTDLTATSGSTEKVVASATGQITITPGNGVLIIIQARFQTNPSSTSMGDCRLKEGLTIGGSELINANFGDHGDSFTLNTVPLIAFDSSPADTTPDYCLTLQRGNSFTSSVQLSQAPQFFLFEIKQ